VVTIYDRTNAKVKLLQLNDLGCSFCLFLIIKEGLLKQLIVDKK
jgi:hypothetical protein